MKQLLTIAALLFASAGAQAAICYIDHSYTVNGVTSRYTQAVAGVDGDRCRKYASNDINNAGNEISGCTQQSQLYARSSSSVACYAGLTHRYVKGGSLRWSIHSARTFNCVYDPARWYSYSCQ